MKPKLKLLYGLSEIPYLSSNTPTPHLVRANLSFLRTEDGFARAVRAYAKEKKDLTPEETAWIKKVMEKWVFSKKKEIWNDDETIRRLEELLIPRLTEEIDAWKTS